MGIPKFFRWMSERYPLCSQLIAENRIPEFDNLYLDMNGIIHNCSHPDDGNVHFRLSEEKIFIAIFNYIDHLFQKIKPKKVFFMAIDGVAPRAKMNQQRARRFRTAKEAHELRRKAVQRGEELPADDAFDSNCITPGTPFMHRLSQALAYFINKKVSEDSSWHGVHVILSGHEVPGEGEHKIMEYIRLTKAQPDYNPNVRHCLYGLDADLIMLGLLSHEPHFSLLREEVKFGPSRKKKSTNLDSQTFFLMHLSLLREYLDLEFSALKGDLPFEYDLERIIDDFILLALFVGNDFLPHLPGMHINEGALAMMFNVYKRVLPKAGGYVNDSGSIDVARMELMFAELKQFEKEFFEAESSDVSWFRSKMKGSPPSRERQRNGKGKLVLSSRQKELVQQIKDFILERKQDTIHFPNDLPANDRVFIQRLAKKLDMRHGTSTTESSTSNSSKKSQAREKHVYVEFESDEDSGDEETAEARSRILKKYERAEVIDLSEADVVAEEQKLYEEKFQQWKKDYYKEKFEMDVEDETRKVVESYLIGLHWVLQYYYKGVPSWGWFYPYHYAPKISDLERLDQFRVEFDVGIPFLPFEQLMGVLPERSKTHIPEAFRELMSDPSSPIIDFYPSDFELDMNGKKQDWEAVVKIPFIDEKRLLAAMKTKQHRLTAEEENRNTRGPSHLFIFDNEKTDLFRSPLANSFPDILYCNCRMEVFNLPTLSFGQSLRKGLCEGAKVGVRSVAGFPSLNTIPHTGELKAHGVNVFNAESRNESLVLTLKNAWEGMTAEEIAEKLLGTRVFVGYPFLQDALVDWISDELFRYESLGRKRPKLNRGGGVVKTPVEPNDRDYFTGKADRLEHDYSKRSGAVIGPVECMVHARLLKGLVRYDDGALVKDYGGFDEGQDFALQAIVVSVEDEDPRNMEKPSLPVTVEYPLASRAFFIGDLYYGSPAEVFAHKGDSITIKVIIDRAHPKEPTIGKEIAEKFIHSTQYYPSFVVAKRLGVSGLVLSRVAASLHVVLKKEDQRVNLGLNLKFEGKQEKVLGYSRKTNSGWEYSEKAVELIAEYKSCFPDLFFGMERKAKADLYKGEDFYPAEEAVERIHMVKEWLKNCPIRDLERVPLDSEALDKESIKLMEEALERRNEEATHYKVIVVQKVPREALLRPSHAATRLLNQTFELGDRVVFVMDTGNVPIGAKGTVVGIQGSTLDVIFDQTFMSGTTLDGKCSPYHGMTVPRASVLNLTTPQYRRSERQTAPRDMVAKPKTSTKPFPAKEGRNGSFPGTPESGFDMAAILNGLPGPSGPPANVWVRPSFGTSSPQRPNFDRPGAPLFQPAHYSIPPPGPFRPQGGSGRPTFPHNTHPQLQGFQQFPAGGNMDTFQQFPGGNGGTTYRPRGGFGGNVARGRVAFENRVRNS